MPKPAPFTQEGVKRAILAAEKCGKTVYACDVSREGVRLIFHAEASPLEAEAVSSIEPQPKQWGPVEG